MLAAPFKPPPNPLEVPTLLRSTPSGINEGPYFKYREELGASGRQDTRVSSYGQPGNTMATQMLPGSRNLQDVEGDLTWVRDQLASQKSTEGK